MCGSFLDYKDRPRRQRGFALAPLETATHWIEHMSSVTRRFHTVSAEYIALVQVVPEDARVFAFPRDNPAVVDRVVIGGIYPIDEFRIPPELVDMCIGHDGDMHRFVDLDRAEEQLIVLIAKHISTTRSYSAANRDILKNIKHQTLAICRAFVAKHADYYFRQCRVFDKELCMQAVTRCPHLLEHVPERFRTDDLIDAALGIPIPTASTPRTTRSSIYGTIARSFATALNCLSAEQQTHERVAWVLSLRDGGTDHIGTLKVPLTQKQWRSALEMDGRCLEHVPSEFRTREMFEIAVLHRTQGHCNAGPRSYNIGFMSKQEQEGNMDIVYLAITAWYDAIAHGYCKVFNETLSVLAARESGRVMEGAEVTPRIQEGLDYYEREVFPHLRQPSGGGYSVYRRQPYHLDLEKAFEKPPVDFWEDRLAKAEAAKDENLRAFMEELNSVVV
jgi:hypothetical protein